MAKPTCKRCGRVLKDPASIARGLGPKCAGRGGKGTRARIPKSSRHTGQRYTLSTGGGGQFQLFAQDVAQEEWEPRSEKRVRVQSAKVQRRKNFERRQPFQCGINTQTRQAIVYSPMPEGDWINSEGHRTSHEALGKYLQAYGWI